MWGRDGQGAGAGGQLQTFHLVLRVGYKNLPFPKYEKPCHMQVKPSLHTHARNPVQVEKNENKNNSKRSKISFNCRQNIDSADFPLEDQHKCINIELVIQVQLPHVTPATGNREFVVNISLKLFIVAMSYIASLYNFCNKCVKKMETTEGSLSFCLARILRNILPFTFCYFLFHVCIKLCLFCFCYSSLYVGLK